jgi:hypothetical protein
VGMYSCCAVPCAVYGNTFAAAPLPQAQVEKMQSEREAAGRDIAVLRTDLDAARSDRERTQAEVERLQSEIARYKDVGGKSVETVEMLSHSKATLEAQLDTQRRWAARCPATPVALAVCLPVLGQLIHVGI